MTGRTSVFKLGGHGLKWTAMYRTGYLDDSNRMAHETKRSFNRKELFLLEFSDS